MTIEIINALIDLNKFKREPHYLEYSLKKGDPAKMLLPRAAKILYEEALLVQQKGLFSKVEIYELEKIKIPIKKPDPVLIGFDHFGNKFPITYWGGDKKV
ncbi:MAG: hypothetical protein PHH54_02260 [Candidatus Nanoarchaeia archaeon]|nr:hypothetical protein [Candidatus Nanoarchaeia archaeon]MDD5740785.1 hypothetical protein [Candidatus Nanoarchaeia archaeon]